MPSSRRALLTSIGVAATGLAGCAGPGDGSSEPSTRSSTDTATPTGTPTDATVTLGDAVAIEGVNITVSDLVTAHSVRYLTAPDAMGVTTAATADQFVFVDVSVRSPADGSVSGDEVPAPSRFGLVAGGDWHGPGIESVGPARVDAPVSGRGYDDSTPEGFLAFRVPAPLDAESVAVVFGSGPNETDTQPGAEVDARWTVPASAAEPLRSPPPAFSVDVDVPDGVAADEPIPVTVEVTNEGDGPGVFHGAINHQGPLYSAAGFDVSLSPGESDTHEARIDYHLDGETPPARVQFAVIGPQVDRSFAVTVEGGGTPDGTGTGTAIRRLRRPRNW